MWGARAIPWAGVGPMTNSIHPLSLARLLLPIILVVGHTQIPLPSQWQVEAESVRRWALFTPNHSPPPVTFMGESVFLNIMNVREFMLHCLKIVWLVLVHTFMEEGVNKNQWRNVRQNKKKSSSTGGGWWQMIVGLLKFLILTTAELARNVYTMSVKVQN